MDKNKFRDCLADNLQYQKPCSITARVKRWTMCFAIPNYKTTYTYICQYCKKSVGVGVRLLDFCLK